MSELYTEEEQKKLDDMDKWITGFDELIEKIDQGIVRREESIKRMLLPFYVPMLREDAVYE